MKKITDVYGIGNLDLEANVNPIMVNRVLTGKPYSPYEIIRVQTESGLFPIFIIYDTGSELSLCNYETGPVVADTI